ncbi:MAG: zinc ribbon domain-containing protein [Candidatus Nitrosopolaris sp.]|jgi:putative transposase
MCKQTGTKGDTICDIELGNNPRSRVTVKSQRDRNSKWAFGELRQFLTYKANSEGVPLRVVDPKNTSRECPKCQYVNKKNRNKNQFECLQCEYKDMADYVALPLALLGLRSNSLL